MSRPLRPLISRERAARAALSVIDAKGLDALSLEQVAQKLGVKAPSLYHHFSDKAEILAEVARLILVDVEVPDMRQGAWEDNVIALCIATRRSILKHPNAAALLLQFFPRHLVLGAYNRAVQTYPFAPSENLMLMEGIEKLTYGSALFEAAARARGLPNIPKFNESRYPHLAEAIRVNELNDEELFVETVRTFMAGHLSRRFAKPIKPAARATTPRTRRARTATG